MAKLTKYEKETIVLFNEGEDKATIYTYNAGLRNRLAAFSKKYPDLCRLEKSCEQGGVSDLAEAHRKGTERTAKGLHAGGHQGRTYPSLS